MRARSLTIAALAAAALATGACGSDEGDTATNEPAAVVPAATEPAPATTATTATPGETATLAISKDRSIKPAIPKPEGDPPTELVIQDVVKGKGPAAKAGDSVTVNYVGVLHATGQQFDASWDRSQTFEFTLGAGEVIGGWDEGVAGMRAGGRRTLIIPPDLAYGPQGQGSIGPNATLVFVVDLEKLTAG